MKRYMVFAIALILLAASISGCRGAEPAQGQEVAFEQLFSAPQQYHGKIITTESFYFHGFETIVLAGALELSGYAEGHLFPEGNMLWIEGGIPVETYDRLYQQQMMGPTERYGKIRVTGKFQYGGQYGHGGAFSHQITPSQVELLPWTPP